MLANKSPPVIGVYGNRGGFGDVATSPRSPLELKIQSPRGLKNFDLGRVGLAIVASLEKSSDSGCEILAKYAVCSPKSNRSDPMPVSSTKNSTIFSGGFDELETESLEDYTYVTRHVPNKSFTKVYCDGGQEYGRSGVDRRRKNLSAFSISPAIYVEDVPALPKDDFLSSCHLCRKKLHGKDIYMYRDKAFCSTECRQRQIAIDEREEQCRTEASRSVADVSNSPYSIFSNGILAI
ncbi:hypothetical protein L1049_022832 [Liquidambar formosana]|uniref:FLZ-type domain-containing protein n=1 Tax=Liquidambar formosana TaxID=63359 RepID=A0AAP0RD36_LIQFO